MITKTTGRIAAAVTAALLAVISTLSAFGATTEYHAMEDNAGVFTQEERAGLEDAMEAAGKQSGWQIIIYTASYGISADDMEDFYNREVHDKASFEESNVMLIIDVASDKRIILTHGDAMYYFSDDRMTDIKAAMKPYLNEGDLYGASHKFVEKTRSYYQLGKDTDGEFSNIEINEKLDNPFLYTLKKFGIFAFLIGAAVGAAIFVIVILSYKNNGKSGTYDLNSNSSLKLLNKQDEFLDRNVTYTVEAASTSGSDSSGGSSSGGGSSHGSSGAF